MRNVGMLHALASAALSTVVLESLPAQPEAPLVLRRSSVRPTRAKGGTFKQKARQQIARNAKRRAR